MSDWHWGDDEDEPVDPFPGAEPPALTVSDRLELGRLLGPTGETLRVAYDRLSVPFGFQGRR